MKQFLKTFDQFGVSLTQAVDRNQPFYRTKVGGIASFLIYSASLTYAIYVIVLWSNGQFSPKVSSTMKLKDFAGSKMDFNLVSMGFWLYNETLIDPFRAQGNILTPLAYKTVDNVGNTTINFLNDNAEDLTDYGVQKINPNFQLTFSSDPITGLTYVTSDMYLLLARCESKYMKEGQYCADEETINAFFKQRFNNIMVYLEYTQWDPLTKELEHQSDRLYFQMDDLTCYSHTLKLTTTQYEIRDSIIPGQSQFETYVDGSSSQGQTSSIEYCKNAFDVDAYVVLYIFVDSFQTQTLFDYPNAGDILANIGSIVSILFMTKHIIRAFNQFFLQKKIISQLCEFYYPEFNKILVKYNWRRQIKQVSLKGKLIDIQAYEKFELKIKDMMSSKISFSNMIYELSRLEFIIRSLISREELRKCHGVGIKVRLKEFAPDKNVGELIEMQSQNSSPRQFEMQNGLLLGDDDCNGLALDHREQYRSNKVEEEQQGINYYDLNQIII